MYDTLNTYYKNIIIMIGDVKIRNKNNMKKMHLSFLLVYCVDKNAK